MILDSVVGRTLIGDADGAVCAYLVELGNRFIREGDPEASPEYQRAAAAGVIREWIEEKKAWKKFPRTMSLAIHYQKKYENYLQKWWREHPQE